MSSQIRYDLSKIADQGAMGGRFSGREIADLFVANDRLRDVINLDARATQMIFDLTQRAANSPQMTG